MPPSGPTTSMISPAPATGTALSETIGIGKSTIAYDDFGKAELIVVMGQNPGTNHPRMLTALANAKRSGATVVTVNPLPEAGLVRFKDPQTVRGVLGKGEVLADQFLQIRLNGDLALFQAIGRRLLELDAVDHEFLAAHCTGLEAYADHVRAADPSVVARATGGTDLAQGGTF